MAKKPPNPIHQRGISLCDADRSLTLWVRATIACLAVFAVHWVGAESRAQETPLPLREMPWFDPAGIRGSLVLCGGGDLPDDVRKKFVELAGGEKARIAVIGTDTPAELDPWKSLGVGSVEHLHASNREEANDPNFVKPLTQATAVWLAGGEQSVLVKAYLGTAVERELSALLERGGVIGGAGAGAECMTRVMIAGGDDVPELATGFDLLSGAVVDSQFEIENRKSRLFAALAKKPGLVGIGIDRGTALVVRGRRLEVLGSSTVTFCLAASESRPQREIVLKSGEAHDLTALRRAALSRALPTFPAREAAAPVVPNGSLVIVGGGGMPKEIVEKFIELAGGPEAPIVVLPTANPESPRSDRSERTFFERAGAKDVKVLQQRTRAEVESPEFGAALAAAKGVWFGGGRQWRFVDAYAQTKAATLFQNVLRRGGVIGGSSAGASIQADYLVRGSPLGNSEMMSEGYERGLGFLPGVAVDQHFTQRKRFADMTGVMKAFPQILGIGIDEATALIVQGQTAEVVGRNNVQFYDYRTGTPHGEIDYLVVKPGGRFDLVERKVIERNDQ